MWTNENPSGGEGAAVHSGWEIQTPASLGGIHALTNLSSVSLLFQRLCSHLTLDFQPLR